MASDTRRVWAGSMPAAYDRYLGPTVFGPFALDLAARAARLRPGAVLEIAAGTGIVTRELVALPGATVTATDLNDAMVAHGARAVPQATWERADAQALPYDDGRFDLVACQFGAMFFPDRPAAYAQARRVLAPGGRLLFNTWAALDTHEFERAVVAAVRRLFPDDPPLFLVEIPHGYADVEQVVADVRAGGFDTVEVETVTVTGEVASAADLATGYCTGTPMRAQIERRADLAETTAALARLLTAELGTGPLTGRMSAHVVEARRT